MLRRLTFRLQTLRRSLAHAVTGPQALAILPVAMVATFWAGGEPAMFLAAMVIPAGLVLASVLDLARRNGVHGLEDRPAKAAGRSLEEALDKVIQQSRDHGGLAACIVLELENYTAVLGAQGQDAASSAADHVAYRLRSNLRRRDQIFFLGRGRFGISLAPVKSLSHETVESLAHRIQEELQTTVGGTAPSLCFSTCIGISFADIKGRQSGADLVATASAALAEARDFAPSTIRVYRPQADRRGGGPRPLRLHDEVVRALENGEVNAWFQPQLCTHTGQVSGFEALARWSHPQRGVLPPVKFLPYLERAGLTGRLQSVMLREALGALGKWHAHGFDIPTVGVNFSPGDLRDPALADNVAWELDRHELDAQRLNVEILETVVSVSPDDETVRNIQRLSELGCRIDLDDFGTGHASISSLQRFKLHRLKIDRSFISKIDSDQGRQRMVSAILTMAEQLELDTLAEGVETAGEHTRLAQLGCGHVQGFGIARPMPLDQTFTWLREHRDRLESPPDIRSGTG